MVFIVVTIHFLCVAVAYKIILKCCYNSEIYSAVHKIQYIHKCHVVVFYVNIL